MNAQIQLMIQQAIQAFQGGNFDSSDLILKRVLQVDSKNLLALHILGLIKISQSNYREAAEYLARAAKINPNDASIQFNLAKALADSGNAKDALAHHKKAVALAPNNPEAWLSYGKTASNLGRHKDALVFYGEALNLRPEYPEAHYNKGNTLNEMGCYEEAIAQFDIALNLRPNYAESWSNKGLTLHEMKRYGEAITHYDKALGLKPDYHDASWNKSLSLLIQGDYEHGFPLYESRWNSEKVSAIAGKRIFRKPVWLGAESLKDKTIYLYGEQGFGDFIQFCRYVKLVADLGAKVILETPLSLANLVKGLEGVSQLVIKGEELPLFDYQCPLLSLPLAFRTTLTTIPCNGPYLFADANKSMEWSRRLGLKIKPRIGLAWNGNAHHKNDHNRSLLLEKILPYLPNQFQYISLQNEVREVDKKILDSNPQILNFAPNLNDFVDTATLIDNLDLVISVDTSVAHLSGALGKKTLVLLPYAPDWRWLAYCADSPWYPSIKLYRQPIIGDWDSVLNNVNSNLNNSCDF